MSLKKLRKRTIVLGLVIVNGLNFTTWSIIAYLGLNPLDYRILGFLSLIIGTAIVGLIAKNERIEHLTMVWLSVWALDFLNVIIQAKPLSVWFGGGFLSGVCAVLGGYLSSRFKKSEASTIPLDKI